MPRPRPSFTALTAATMLFMLDGLFTLTRGVGVPAPPWPGSEGEPFALLDALPVTLGVIALLSPLLPVTRRPGRHTTVAVTAGVAAVARVLLCVESYPIRLVGGVVVVAAGALYLSSAVGYLERRSVAAGLGAAIVLDQLARFAGSGVPATLAPSWLGPQLLISAAVIGAAVAWQRTPAPEPEKAGRSFERRIGGLRLRSGIALAMILFVDLHLLARPDAAARLTGVHPDAAAALLVGAGIAALLVLLAGREGRGRRRTSALLATAVTVSVVGTPLAGGWTGMGLLAVGHAAALLLLARVLAPASGRRQGGTTALALLLWLLVAALHAVAPRAVGTALFLAAGAVLLLMLMALPRPMPAPRSN
jgi:hypothetical protein